MAHLGLQSKGMRETHWNFNLDGKKICPKVNSMFGKEPSK